jgi:hypothetical protein
MPPKLLIEAGPWLAKYEGNPIPINDLKCLRKDDLLVLSEHFGLDRKP